MQSYVIIDEDDDDEEREIKQELIDTQNQENYDYEQATR